MRFRDVGIRTKAMAGGLVPMLLLVILTAVAWLSIQSMSDSIAIKDQTYRIIQRTEDIEKHAVDMETGLHGYLLTGKEGFLEPYALAEKTIFDDIAELKKQLRKKDQIDLLDQIDTILKAWKSQVAEPEIRLRREVGQAKDMNHLAVLVAESSSNKSFDELSGMLKGFVKDEEARLAKRLNQANEPTEKDGAPQGTFWVIDETELAKDSLRLGSAALELEVGLRGYLLTGKHQFLENYRAGLESFYQKTAWLQNRVSQQS